MASPAPDLADLPPTLHESPHEAAFSEAEKWIEQVTGRSFGEKDFRSGLENGILLCELLNAIRPGLVKKINRLPTPIAGLDNLVVFLRGCKELGLKESQLFDPGDLQDTSNRAAVKVTECSRKLKNVLVTIYWLGKAANSCTSYSGATLDLKEFEGLLAQMRKESDDVESPKRSIRDSGYIDCWDSERSDSLSPPRHGRDDSFDSLDSFGSRSQQTPSPDVILRGSSDGRGSDSESDFPHRKIPDVKKDDMSARRVSYGDNKAFVPFNQYLPNKSNQSAYIPAPLRKKKAEREEYRKSWSTATSPLGGERTFRSMSMFDMRCDDETQPHSRIHQEHLQNVNSLLKEEDDQWQNDLARWKTRRRSASQDLIQKEQERKKMEKVLSGEDALSERRKSIKTYKEIVEEKERREKELHEAYKNAKSEEEAERILQKYIERFTISEAVLERLQMPKILERSQSVQPNLFSLPEDPSPMKYLRQQSVPVSVPKFTSTVEATISPSCEAEVRLLPERTSPNKPVSKAVPLLVPKPYSQPKSTQGLRTFKVEGNVSMNGESFNGIEDENGSKGSAMVFEASPDRSEAFEGVSRVDGSPEELKQESTRFELDLQQSVYRSMCNTLMALPREETKYADQHAENNLSGRTEGTHSAPVTTVLLQSQQTSALFSVTVPSNLECASPNHQEEAIVALNYKGSMDKGDLEGILPKQKVVKCEEKELEEYAVSEFSNKTPEVTRPPCQNTIQQVNSNSCEKSPESVRFISQVKRVVTFEIVLTPSLNSSKHVNFWSWDPEEERKRQERWQQEQERLLQERKIIEDTIVPFAVSSSSAETFSSCSSSVTEDNRSSESLVRSVPELKPNHVVAENQKCAAWKNCDETEQKAVRTHSENHNPLWDEEGELQLSSGRGEPQQEETSRKEVSTICHDTTTLIRSEQASQVLTEARNSPTRMQLQLQGAPRMTQPSLEEALTLEELRLKAPSLNQSSTLPAQTSGGIRGSGSHENVKPGLSSPCSPTPQCHSPNRSISGKKLCSTCGLPLGKGAAMIIETLSLFFHIQCFQCGICKGQLGDTTSGTDVRIRNGLLNCNDCYMRSRTAGQPTTL